ncbi:MAG: Aspartokinase, partial [uncultured bacterium]
MYVCKFGGTSVADAPQLRQVQQIVAADVRRQVIVTSAPAGMTNALLQIWELVSTRHDWSAIWQSEITRRFRAIALDCGVLNADIADVLQHTFATMCSGQVDRDYIASRGEAIHSHVVAAILEARRIEAATVIKFDQQGQLDTETTYALLRTACVGDNRIVLGGFYGSLPNG